MTRTNEIDKSIFNAVTSPFSQDSEKIISYLYYCYRYGISASFVITLPLRRTPKAYLISRQNKSMVKPLLVSAAAMTAICMCISGVLAANHAKRTKIKSHLLFAVSWFLQSMFWFFDMAAHLRSDAGLMRVGVFFNVTSIVCLFVFIEINSKESINPALLGAICIIGTLYITFCFVPSSLSEDPGYGVHFSGWARLFQIFFILYSGLIYLVWAIKARKYAPANLRRQGNLIMFGGILFSLATFVLYIFASFYIIFNPLTLFTHGIGALITVVVMVKNPELFFILPFRAIRLTVLESNGGIAIYNHSWFEENSPISDTLFTGMLQGVQLIMKEVLNQGQIKEIKLEQAILMLYRIEKYPFVFVLVTSRSSHILRNSFQAFARKFVQSCGAELSRIPDISKFNVADNLVEQCFPNLPIYE